MCRCTLTAYHHPSKNTSIHKQVRTKRTNKWGEKNNLACPLLAKCVILTAWARAVTLHLKENYNLYKISPSLAIFNSNMVQCRNYMNSFIEWNLNEVNIFWLWVPVHVPWCKTLCRWHEYLCSTAQDEEQESQQNTEPFEQHTLYLSAGTKWLRLLNITMVPWEKKIRHFSLSLERISSNFHSF